MNSQIFACFIKEKQNSLLKTLKLSNFELKRTTADMRNALAQQFPILQPQLQQFTKSLSILRCKDPYFRIDSSTKDLEQIRFRKKNSNNNNQLSSNTTSSSIDELPFFLDNSDFMYFDESHLYLDRSDDLLFGNELEIGFASSDI